MGDLCPSEATASSQVRFTRASEMVPDVYLQAVSWWFESPFLFISQHHSEKSLWIFHLPVDILALLLQSDLTCFLGTH